MPAPGRLFASSDPKRFFELPDGLVPAPGSLRIRNMLGEQHDVDPEAVKAFELTPAQAQTHMAAEMANFARKATGAVGAFAAAMRDAAGKPLPPPETPPTDAAAAVGITAERVRENPGAVMDGLKSIIEGIVATTKREAGDRSDVDAVVSGLRDVLTDPLLGEKIRDAAARLNLAAEALRPAPEAPNKEDDPA